MICISKQLNVVSKKKPTTHILVKCVLQIKFKRKNPADPRKVN